MLKIAKDLSLPIDAITDTFCILAKRGVGKTHLASIMAEEMLKAGQPIVAYDPTGAWWGLKSSADGKRPGFPVVVFGGEHADVPLEETAGDTIAQTIVDKRIPAILDCSLLRKAARIRFMTAFAETLYHKNREPLHFFVDEAHTVAPQNIRSAPELSKLLGALEDIILQGRRRGLGLTAISPRPAMLNTSIRSACSTLIALQIIGPHDRKAVKEWVDAHGSEADLAAFFTSLAALPRGEGWVWNPGADIFKHVKFRGRETFDSSFTPKVGGKVVTPQRMATVDLDKLGDAIRATVESAKANDPKALKAKVAELERQLRTAGAKVDSNAIAAAEERGRKAALAEANEAIRQGCAVIQLLETKLAKIAELAKRPEALAENSPVLKTSPSRSIERRIAEQTARPKTAAARETRPAGIAPHDLTVTQQRILDTVWVLRTRGLEVDRVSVARWMAIHPKGGRYGSDLAALRAAGYLDGFTLTDRGEFMASPCETGLQALLAALPDETKRRLMSTIADGGPYTRESLATELGIHPNGGRYGSDLAWLRAMHVITERGPIEATPGALA